MNYIDIFIIVFVLLFMYNGYRRGFIIESIGFLGFILGLLFSYMAHPVFKDIVESFGLKGDVASIVAYIAGVFIIYVIVIVLGSLIEKFLHVLRLGFVNNFIGALIGAVKSILIISALIWVIISILPPETKVVKVINESPVAVKVKKVIPYCYDAIVSFSKSENNSLFK